jgi:hypothetical protein
VYEETIKTQQRTEIDMWCWAVIKKQHRTALKTLHRVLGTAGAAIQTLHRSVLQAAPAEAVTVTETLLMKEINMSCTSVIEMLSGTAIKTQGARTAKECPSGSDLVALLRLSLLLLAVMQSTKELLVKRGCKAAEHVHLEFRGRSSAMSTQLLLFLMPVKKTGFTTSWAKHVGDGLDFV